jgi:H+/Cl- antiporter ClcA
MTELWTRARVLARWVVLGGVVGLLCGGASALFLHLLDLATTTRIAHERLVWALPVAGLAIGWFYERYGASIAGGSGMVLRTAREGGPLIPLRMAPMVLVGTVLTHLFGGSAGREGTAVQMGASMADGVAHLLGLDDRQRRELVCAGLAGGFGAVFGTPVAGTIFALEVVTPGRTRYEALVPALVAALLGDRVCQLLGATHTAYAHPAPLAMTGLVALKWAAFALGMSAATWAFIQLTHWLKHHMTRLFPRLPVRMMAGGTLVVLLWQLVGTGDFLGLGVPMIVRSLVDPTLPWWTFAAKLLFTSVTLAAGYLGGEVTPLFFVGASLGNALARLLELPLTLGAAVGLATVFGAAANAPFALIIMVVELVGADVLPHVLLVMSLTYVLTGHRSIYGAQPMEDKPTLAGPN